eukprot:scaffold1495_cov248-Pinguiococcus_pyrenoidosus.AAC.6
MTTRPSVMLSYVIEVFCQSVISVSSPTGWGVMKRSSTSSPTAPEATTKRPFFPSSGRSMRSIMRIRWAEIGTHFRFSPSSA